MKKEHGGLAPSMIAGKKVAVYPCPAPDRPVIYLNTFANEGAQVKQALYEMGCMDFNLVTVGGLDWDHDMAPWDIPPITKDDTPCTGGADAYLKLLVEKIAPTAEKQLQGQALWRGLAGYSLAGLFAVYSIYQTGFFERIASVSGSLWFPGFADHACTRKMNDRTKHVYFSLGEKESQTGNPYLRSVRENTEKIHNFYSQQGIDTVFQLNPGNHHKNAVGRTAAGISWLLSR